MTAATETSTLRARCYRVFVDTGELWDCLLVVDEPERPRRYALYTSVDQLPRPHHASVDPLASLRRLVVDDAVRRPSASTAAAVVDANSLERVIKTLDVSDSFRRSAVTRRDANGVRVSTPDDAVSVRVHDVVLVTPDKYRLSYTWCELYEKTDIEYRELENTMAWLSTLGGAFSSLGDQTKQCAIVAGKISQQQLKIAMRIGDPLTAVRCKLYAAISLMQRGFFKQAKSIVQSQYVYIKSQLIIDERLVKMCYGIWTKLRYERSRKKILNSSHVL